MLLGSIDEYLIVDVGSVIGWLHAAFVDDMARAQELLRAFARSIQRARADDDGFLL